MNTNTETKQASQSLLDVVKVLVNLNNNVLYTNSIIKDKRVKNRQLINAMSRVKRVSETQIADIKGMMPFNYRSLIDKEMTNEDNTLQAEGAKDLFLQLSPSARDFIEEVMTSIIKYSLDEGDKKECFDLRCEIFDIMEGMSASTLGTILTYIKTLKR